MTVQHLSAEWIDQARVIESHCFNDPWSTSLWNRYLQQSYVLAEKDQLYAYAQCSVVLDEAELLRIAVAPEQRQKGYGKTLFVEICQQLQRQNVSRLMLEVRASNHAAIKLYQACGMHQDGCRPHYYETHLADQREDALLFSLDLSVLK